MEDPLEVLTEEHEVIKRVLVALRGITREMRSGYKPTVEELERFVDFIKTFADSCHHSKEEGSLFPALEARGISRIGGPIGVMLQEHEQGRSFVRGMLEAIDAIEGGDEQGYGAFERNASAYVSLLEDHIFKEDNILYPMGRGVLGVEDLERLLDSFKEVEAEVGLGVHEKYKRLAEELGSKYG